MSNKFTKKIAIGILVSIFSTILIWITWMTKMAFSAERTNMVFQEFKISTIKKQDQFENELKKINENISAVRSGLSELKGSTSEINENMKLLLNHSLRK